MRTGKLKKIKKLYKFMVLDKNQKWSAWTGTFETEESAMAWFKKHGQSHLDNNHTLGLFYKNECLQKFTPNEITNY